MATLRVRGVAPLFGSVTSIVFYTMLSEYDQVCYMCSVLHLTILIISVIGSYDGISRVDRVGRKLAVVFTNLDNLVHDQDRRIPRKTSNGTPSLYSAC